MDIQSLNHICPGDNLILIHQFYPAWSLTQIHSKILLVTRKCLLLIVLGDSELLGIGNKTMMRSSFQELRIVQCIFLCAVLALHVGIESALTMEMRNLLQGCLIDEFERVPSNSTSRRRLKDLNVVRKKTEQETQK